MSNQHEKMAIEGKIQLVRDLAQRIREGRLPEEIGKTAIDWTKEVWRHEGARSDAQIIINAFPADFPLMGVRAAE